MRKTTILHVHEKFYPHMGGSTHRLLNLLRGVDYNKFEIIVLCENSENVTNYQFYDGIHIYRFKTYWEIPIIMKKISNEYDIDILHVHNYRPSFFAYLGNIFLKKKMILEMHSIYDVTNRVKELLGIILLKKAEKIIVLSEKSKECLEEKYYINEEKIKVIYNGINLQESKEEKPKDELLLDLIEDTENIVISYIGSMDYFQGIDNICEVINQVTNPKACFIIIGGSNEEINCVKSKVRSKKAYFSKYIEKEYIRYIYQHTDYLMVLRPSLLMTETAVPLKPLEALQNSVEVLSTKVGGMIELASKLNTDKILFFDDLDQVTDYINSKITKKEQYDCDLSLFSVESQSKKLQELYLEVLDVYAK